MSKNILNIGAVIISIIGAFFITAPIIHIFVKLSSKNLISTLKDGVVWHSIFTSIYCALWATVVGCFIGIPLGYVLSRTQFKGKSVVESIINIPVAIPHVAVGIALISLFNERTFVGHIFKTINISFVDTVYGIVLAMMFVSISFIISSSVVGFDSVEEEIEMVAKSLGASSTYTFFRITFPLALPSIIRGAVLAFARSISEVGALLIIAYFPKTAPIVMYERFEEYGLNAARPVCALVIFLCTVIFFTLLYFSRRNVRH